jgi:hypothetical protein
MKFKYWTTVALTAFALTLPLSAQNPDATSSKIRPGQMKVRTWTKPPQLTPQQVQSLSKTQPTLPLWYYGLTSPRDDNPYTGVVVGNDPEQSNSGEADVPTQIIPLIITTHRIVTSVNPDGTYNTIPGDHTFDPTIPDPGCLAPPNDVPLTVTEQSPVFQSTNFTMGGTDVGTTQYGDAFQRANFWNVIKRNKYHVLLNPVTTLQPILLDIPAESGVAVPPEIFGLCGWAGNIDINFVDPFLDQYILPALYFQGVNSSTFPIFLIYNVAMTAGPPAIPDCCITGYHGWNNLQTYTVSWFQNTHFFGPGFDDTSTLTHEVGEWMNDPYGYNFTPAWGHIGQQPGCQNNYEVADPLTATNLPLVTMPNGFSYHLQEMAFFNWFYEGPSVGVNGWYSDNDTFTTDAGPVCQP